MRHGASGRRSRNRGGNGGHSGHRRGGGGGGGHNRSQVFDSNGPDVRIRGTAYQIYEKYVALAKDAAGIGDRIMEESYLQHAEHYQRVINIWAEAAGEDRHHNQHQQHHQQQAPAADSQGNNESSGENNSFRHQHKKRDEDLGLPPSMLIPAREPEQGAAKKDELQDA